MCGTVSRELGGLVTTGEGTWLAFSAVSDADTTLFGAIFAAFARAELPARTMF